MKKLFFILLLFGFVLHNLSSQRSFILEVSEGFVFFDYFGKEPERFDNVFAGYGLQSEVSVWREVYQYKFIQTKLGIGYTNFYYLNSNSGLYFISRHEDATSYANLKLGIELKPNWSKINFMLNSTHYILLHKEKQQNSQNRWFTNLDIGLKFKLFGDFNISLWSPLTISPTHYGPRVYRPLDLFGVDFDPYIEITGLNLGLSYGFGGKK